MGADLILEHLWIAKDREPDWQAARGAIREMDDPAAVEWSELTGWDPDDDSTLMQTAQTLDPEDWVSSVRARLLADVDDVEAAWKSDRRDASVCDFGPIRVLIAGGMSFGDDPSDAFAFIQRFAESPGAKAAGFFVWENSGEHVRPYVTIG